MKIEVEFFSLIQDIAKKRYHNVSMGEAPLRLRDLMNRITGEFGDGMMDALFDKTKESLNSGILVAVNGKNCYFLEGLETPLHEGDRVTIGVAFRGG